jgi:hypothetical protein
VTALARRFAVLSALVCFLSVLPGVAYADVGSSIVQRFWDSVVTLVNQRVQNQAPTVGTFLEDAERVILGSDDDITMMPAVQDVFNAMRVVGLMLLAFCTVISLVELTESGITGGGGNLVSWFKRFFTATLLTFGGLHFYAIWIRLFNVLLGSFRAYLDAHWTSQSTSQLYIWVAQIFTASTMPLILGPFLALTVVILLVLWFLVGGVRKAELMLSVMIAPLVWPVYLIPSMDDMPKTAFRGFLGLNATLLIVVGMIRLAVRLAIGAGGVLNIWNVVPALSLLVMAVFLPTIVKRIVGQGHTGVGALMTAVQIASGIKFLSMGAGAAAAASSVAPPASSPIPQTTPAVSSYPTATAPPAQAGARGALGAGAPTVYQQARIRTTLPAGATAVAPTLLEAPVPASETTLDLHETAPGRFDVAEAHLQYTKGRQAFDSQSHR